MSIRGHFDKQFSAVVQLLEENIRSGSENGASLYVNVDGRDVVNVYGGFRDEARTETWDENTIANVWSSTKTVVALSLLVLHDRGLLDVNEKVSTYWPEFAAGGKGDVRVRHLLSHSSGLPGWEPPIDITTLFDAKQATSLLEQQIPWWTPGKQSGYHALTSGYLIGEIVRRVSGKSLTQFIAEEIAGPLDADFQIGVKTADLTRVSTMIPPPPSQINLTQIDPTSVMFRTLTAPPFDASICNTSEWRNAEIGAANGHGNAHSLGRILSTLSLGGTIGDCKLLSPQAIGLIFEEQTNGLDLVIGQPIRYGIGFGLAGGATEQTVKFLPKGLQRRIAFWGGLGGSFNVVDLDKRLTISYVMNKMGEGTLGSERTASYVRSIYVAMNLLPEIDMQS